MRREPSRPTCGTSLLRCLAGFAVAGIVLAAGIEVHAAAERPNFVVFVADDMACEDCGAYGHPRIRTPNIDRLAREGLRFDNAFLTCSSCSPSRSSILTGRYPHATGAMQLHLPLPKEQVLFVEPLRSAGYYVASSGKWHLGDATVEKFDHVETRLGHWVQTLQRRPRDKPFFLWLAFSDPHRPYAKNTIPVPHGPRDAVVPPYLPDTEEVRRDLAMYYDEISRLDGVVGQVLDELDAQKIADETCVVFLTDNGRPFPRCKTTVYDSGIRTPFLVRWPGRVKAGTVTAALVSSIDLAPTVLELADITPPASFQGVPFVDVLDDREASVREYVHAEHNWHDFDDCGRAVRSLDWKYVRNFYADIPGTPPADAVRSPTFEAMRTLRDRGRLTPAQRNCFLKPRPAEELYHVSEDPHELTNLADDPRHAAVLERMRRELARWQQATGDVVPTKRRPDEFDRETGQRLGAR